jgi:hypothetical protein
LNYAHENHVVHRDIKPANIMIAPNRAVKIMDFGIAQIPMGSRTQVGSVLGSPTYMAPEQVAGKSTDGRTDIFALGVVLYEMLTGTTPFKGDNLSAIMYKILNEDPVPPSTFDRIVARALAKRPEDRYPTAREFAHDLRNYEAPSPSEAPQHAIRRKSPQAGQPAGNEEAFPDTTLLSPRKTRNAMAPPPTVNGARLQKEAASRLAQPWLRHPLLLLVIPALAVIALVIVWQGHPAKPVNSPAPVAQAIMKPDIDKPHVAVAPTGVGTSPLVPPLDSVPAKATHPAAAATEPMVFQKSILHIAVSPWGEVFVDGESAGVCPPLTMLKLAPGKHTVEIRNQAFEPYRVEVNPEPGESLKIRYRFR